MAANEWQRNRLTARCRAPGTIRNGCVSYRNEESADLRQSQGDAGVSFGRRGVRRDLHVQVVVEVFVTRLLRMATFLLLQNKIRRSLSFGERPADYWTSEEAGHLIDVTTRLSDAIITTH